MDTIPIVDFGPSEGAADDPSSEALNRLADEIYQAFSTVGFVYIKNHGISQEKVMTSTSTKYFFQKSKSVIYYNKFHGPDNPP